MGKLGFWVLLLYVPARVRDPRMRGSRAETDVQWRLYHEEAEIACVRLNGRWPLHVAGWFLAALGLGSSRIGAVSMITFRYKHRS